MPNDRKKALGFFILAEVMTFLCITILQITEFPLFLVVLLLMHTGIIMFIVSKKHFHRLHIAVSSFYKTEYLLLALYLPMLFYQVLSYLFHYDVNESFKLIVTIVITTLGIIVSVVNTVRLTAFLKNHS